MNDLMERRSVLGGRDDARVDARADHRAPDIAAEAIRTSRSRMSDLFELLNETMFLDHNASVSHPHGEALRPGARRLCAEREKNAFGGAHSQFFSVHVRSIRSLC